MFVRFLLVLAVAFGIAENANSKSTEAPLGSLFIGISRPGGLPSGVPKSAAFFRLDPSAFHAASRRSPELHEIPDFVLDGRTVTLDVEQFEILDKNAKVLCATTHGDKAFQAPEHVLLKGWIDGEPDSHVYLAVFGSYTLGYIDIHHGDTLLRYLVQPITAAPGEQGQVMTVTREDLAHTSSASQWQCGSEEFAPNMPKMNEIMEEVARVSTAPSPQTTRGGMVHLIDMAIECDQSYFLAHNSDTAQSVNYALAVAGAQSDIYIRDLKSGVFVNYIHVWTVPDPYTGVDNSEILGNFVNYWNNNMANLHRAGALLYTNRGGGGLAYVGQLCIDGDASLAYGVCGLNNNYVFPSDGYIWDVDVSSHEFGHIVGSVHTHNCSWNPPIDSCVAAENGNCYLTPKPRRGTIMSYCHTTPFGTELKFHKRVADYLMTKRLIPSAAPCLGWVEMPVALAGGPDLYTCPGGTVTLGRDTIAGTPPYTYSWRPAAGLSSNALEIVRATPSQTTRYILTVEDANMLRSYDIVTVHVGRPQISAGGDVTACGVSTVTLTGNAIGLAPFHYQWIDKANGAVIANTAQIDVPATAPHTYVLHVLDSIGCDATDSAHVLVQTRQHAEITVSGDSNICQGATAKLTASPGFKSYKWSNGATTRQIILTTSGIYSFVGSNPGVRCDDTSRAVTVHVFPVPTKPIIIRVGDTLISTIASGYQWYSGDTLLSGDSLRTLHPLHVGNYNVKVRNVSGCFARSDPFSYQLNGIRDQSNEAASVRLYPNPAHDQIWLTSTADGIVDFEVKDILGRPLLRTIPPSQSGKAFSIDLHLFPSGTYFVHYRLTSGSEGSLRFVH